MNTEQRCNAAKEALDKTTNQARFTLLLLAAMCAFFALFAYRCGYKDGERDTIRAAQALDRYPSNMIR